MTETLDIYHGVTRGVKSAPPAANECENGHFTRRGKGLEFEMEADWIRLRLPDSAQRVADVGCGNGSLLPVIGVSRSLGIDSSARALCSTHKRFPAVPIVCADAGRLPLADCCLDSITTQHLIEHLVATESACREWWRVLRPGGKLLVLTPNAVFSDPSVYEDKTHVRIFDAEMLRASLVAAGFVVEDLRTIGLPWFARHRRVPLGWRLRRFVTRKARMLSMLPGLRWQGQTLCCAAGKPVE